MLKRLYCSALKHYTHVLVWCRPCTETCTGSWNLPTQSWSHHLRASKMLGSLVPEPRLALFRRKRRRPGEPRPPHTPLPSPPSLPHLQKTRIERRGPNPRATLCPPPGCSTEGSSWTRYACTCACSGIETNLGSGAPIWGLNHPILNDTWTTRYWRYRELKTNYVLMSMKVYSLYNTHAFRSWWISTLVGTLLPPVR